MHDTLKAVDELESCLERYVNALTRRIGSCNPEARKVMDDF